MFQAWGLLSGKCVQVHTDLRGHMKCPCSPPRLQSKQCMELDWHSAHQSTREMPCECWPQSSGQHPESEWTGKWETSGTCVHSPNSWAHLVSRWEPITYPAWGSVAFGSTAEVLLWKWQDRWLRMWPHALSGVKQFPSDFSASGGACDEHLPGSPSPAWCSYR